MKATERILSSKSVRESMLWKKEYAANDWRNGFLQGNGSLAAISYAPGGMEWVINKTDIYDKRVPKANLLPYSDMMEFLKKRGDYSSFDLEEIEPVEGGLGIRSVSAAVLRFCFGNGEMSWSAPAFPKISQTLDIGVGELESSLDAHLMHSKVTSIIPRGRNVLAIRVHGTTVCDKDHKLEIYRPHHDFMEDPEWHNGEGANLAFLQKLPGGGSYAVAVCHKTLEPDIGRVTYELPRDYKYPTSFKAASAPSAKGMTASVYGAGDVEIFVSVVSSEESSDPLAVAIKEANSASASGFDALALENRSFWQEYWEKSAVDFGEYRDLERYWYFSAYELAVSYGKPPVPALSGMFYGPLNPSVPGVSAHNYVHDQNVQIPVMPLPVINHPELIMPLIETYTRNIDNLKEATRRLFAKTGGKGIYVPLVMNQDAKELPSPVYRYTMCGAAYVGLVLLNVYEYTRDTELMREHIYPLVSEFIDFYTENLMQLGEDGLYHLDYTIPPEIFLMTRDETSTLAMLRAAIEIALSYADECGIKDAQTEKWRDVLAKYPPLAKRSSGAFWCGPDIPEDHFSFGTHILYPIFPAEAYMSDEDKLAAKKTLEYIDKEAIERVYAGVDGWHFVHDWSWHLYNSARVRLGENEAVFAELPKFLDYFAKTNGMFVHNSIVIRDPEITEKNHRDHKGENEITADMTNTPWWYGSGKCATANIYSKDMTAPVIEGNSIFLLRATEVLIQSFGGVVRIFPGVPEGFSGEFSGLRAKGGYLVSAKMECGKLTSLSVRSEKAREIILALPIGCEKPSGATELQNGCIRVDIPVGEEIKLI